MQIEEIYVDGFGLMVNKTLAPAPGLTVVRGLNEAGKTTLLAFVRSVLFGFEQKRYAAMAGGRRGGRLTVRMADGRLFKIERYGERGGGGTLRVYDERGTDRGADELGVLLQGVDGQLFRNVFAFGLAELAEFSHLNSQEVAARIYGAGLGLGSVSAIKVEGDLGGRAAALFKPGGSAPVINGVLKDLEKVDANLRGRDLPAEHLAKSRGLAESERARDELTGRLRSLAEEARRYDRQRNAWAPWISLRDAMTAREELGPVTTVSADVAERLTRCETHRDEAAERVARAETELARQREAADGIVPDVAVLERRLAIEELSREAIRDRDRRKEQEAVARDLATANRELADALVRLGPGWTEARVDAFDDSVAVQTAISGRFRGLLDTSAAALATATRTRADIARTLEAERVELGTLDAHVAAIHEAEGALPSVEEQDRRIRDVEGVLGLRKRASEQAALAEQSAITAEAKMTVSPVGLPWADLARETRVLQGVIGQEALLASLASPAPVPGAVPASAAPGGASLVPAFAIGVGAVLVTLILSLLGLPLPAAAAVLVLGIVGAVIAWRSGRKLPGVAETVQSTAAIEEQRRRLGEERVSIAARCGLAPEAGTADVDALLLRCAEAERLAVDAASLRAAALREAAALQSAEAGVRAAAAMAGLPEQPSDEDLVGAAERLAQARERQARRQGLRAQADTLRRRIEGRERELAAAETTLAEATTERVAAEAAWGAWLREHDLDERLDRETAARMIDAVTSAKAPLRARASSEERAAILRADRGEFVATALRLAAELGRPAVGVSLDDVPALERLIVGLETALAAALEAEGKRKEAVRTVDRMAADLQVAQEARDAAEADLAELLEANLAPDAAALRALIDLGDRARRLDDTIAGATATLQGLSGPGPALARLQAGLELVDDISVVETQHAQVRAQIEDLEGERALLYEQIGELRDAVARMEQDAAGATERQRREDLLGQLEVNAANWSTYALARFILATARHAYEAEHRPAVIKTAEAYFREWTADRYRQIIAPVGSQVEAVEHRDGTKVALDDLSTGTAQQLYLAIRFGLLERFAQTAEPLPIVMDDILVNFDDERARLAARSIEELAKHQQVLYFTCHPEIQLDSTNEIKLPRLKTVADARESSEELA